MYFAKCCICFGIIRHCSLACTNICSRSPTPKLSQLHNIPILKLCVCVGIKWQMLFCWMSPWANKKDAGCDWAVSVLFSRVALECTHRELCAKSRSTHRVAIHGGEQTGANITNLQSTFESCRILFALEQLLPMGDSRVTKMALTAMAKRRSDAKCGNLKPRKI